jgi:hypothetical protein
VNATAFVKCCHASRRFDQILQRVERCALGKIGVVDQPIAVCADFDRAGLGRRFRARVDLSSHGDVVHLSRLVRVRFLANRDEQLEDCRRRTFARAALASFELTPVRPLHVAAMLTQAPEHAGRQHRRRARGCSAFE